MDSKQIGFMQGRLSPIVDGKIQSFPWETWEDEFSIAKNNNFPLMEWTLDFERLYENPLMRKSDHQKIKSLMKQNNVTIPSVTGDCFMQMPFYKFEKKTRLTLLQDFKMIINNSAELGVKFIVMPLVDNGSIENVEQERVLYSGLDFLLSTLEETKVKIIFESDFSPLRLKNFIDVLPSKYFGINYDIGNSAALNFELKEEIIAYSDRIDNVHIKDRLLGGTTVPLGQGNANIPLCLELLEQNNYHGNYILQTARSKTGEHLQGLLKYRNFVIEQT